MTFEFQPNDAPRALAPSCSLPVKEEAPGNYNIGMVSSSCLIPSSK